MKKSIVLGILGVLFFSCGQKKDTPLPVNILPKEKMVQIITDLQIAEAENSTPALPDLSVQEVTRKTGQEDLTSKKPIDFQKIFEKNQITKEQYKQSISFYIEHAELLNKIYEEVLNELSKMQAETNKK